MSTAEIEQMIWDIEEGMGKLVAEKRVLEETKKPIKNRIEIIMVEMEKLKKMLEHVEDQAGKWQQHLGDMDDQLEEAKECAEDALQNAGAQTGYLKEQAEALEEYAKEREEQVVDLWNEVDSYEHNVRKLSRGIYKWEEEVKTVTGTWGAK